MSYFRFSVWEWNEQRQQFYLHMHARQQPDLNFRSDHVVREIDVRTKRCETQQVWTGLPRVVHVSRGKK